MYVYEVARNFPLPNYHFPLAILQSSLCKSRELDPDQDMDMFSKDVITHPYHNLNDG